MAGLRAFFARMAALFFRKRLEAEMDAELEAHLDLLTEEHMRKGLEREDARRAARRDFGGLTEVKEAYRDQRGLPVVETLLQDVRFGLRGLRRNPGFAFIAALTLGLGIGGNTAIFSLVNAVLVSGLPVFEPDRLVVVASRDAESSEKRDFSYPMYVDIRDRSDVFSGVLARAGAQVNLSYGGTSEQVTGELVSGNYFETLGVTRWAGRLFTAADDTTPGGHPVAVLSYGFFRTRFGGDPAIVGRSVVLNGHPTTVVGVSPPGFYGTELGHSVDVRVPMTMATVLRPFPPNRLQNRRHHWMTMMGRLKPGVSRARAEASLAVLWRQLRASELPQIPDLSDYEKRRFLAEGVALLPGSHGAGLLRRELSRPLLLLQGVAAMVLLIACANIANLILARNAARRHEVSVRLALGAGRGRLLRQWMTESLLLSFGGGLAGIALAGLMYTGLRSLVPPEQASMLDGALDLRVLAFALIASVATGLITGLAPGLQVSRGAIFATLRGEPSGVASGERILSLRGGLVLAQFALSVPLLVCAGLLAGSLRNLHRVDTGFDRTSIVLGTLNPSLNGYPQERVTAFYREALASVRTLPGVTGAALAASSVLSGSWDRATVAVEGYTPRQGEDMNPHANVISPGYFGTMGMSLAAGRDFAESDRSGAPKVAIVNETMARRFFPGKSPIGRRFTNDPPAAPDIEIVGVVKDAKYVDLRETTPPHIYLPVWQEDRLSDLTLHARTKTDPAGTAAAMRRLLQGIDPDVPLFAVTTLDAQIEASLGRERLVAAFSGLFGLLALVLASIGLYGVVAFSVARRTREIGIRIALGAPRRRVVAMVVKHVAAVVGVGMVLGAAISLGARRALGSLLYEVSATNGAAYLGATLLLAAVALLAAYLPARRAARIDPMMALRAE